MVERRSTRSRPSSRRSVSGFSLVELLVAMAVASVIMGAALSITLSTRDSFTADQNRTGVNQNLRGALDLIGIEIRQAGERLPGDVPALEVRNGTGGSSDTLIIRRNLLSEVLPLCRNLTKGVTDNQVRVADGSSPPPGCEKQLDADGDGYGDNIDVWRDHRAAEGGAVPAFVYNPILRLGEFFVYQGDPSNKTYLGKSNTDAWSRDYKVNQNCRIYLLEQRSFDVQHGLFRYALNEDGSSTVHLSTNIHDFQIQAVMKDGTVLSAMNETGQWTDLRAIEVTLTGLDTIDHESVTRTVSARFFPRNILSN